MGSLGAIVNNNTAAGSKYNTNDLGNLRYVTLAGDTTFGGNTNPQSAAPAVGTCAAPEQHLARTGSPALSTLSLRSAHNQVTLVGVAVDNGVGDVNVQSGIFSVETSSNLGDPAYTVFVAERRDFSDVQSHHPVE